MVKISVIVPVYNAEKYLNRCVNSILQQTFSDFEIILVDDGSEDQSRNICDEYAKKDKRIKVIHQKNKGQAAARNRGISYAEGEWVSFVDADDMIHQQLLECLYQAAIHLNTKLAVCKAIEGKECPRGFFSEQNCKYTAVQADESRLLQWCTENNINVADKYVYWIVWGKLIHKSILEKFPFEEGRIYEDNAVVFKWLYFAGRIAACDNVMYFYYANNDGTTKGNYSVRKLDWLWALEEQIRFYKKIKYYRLVNAVGIRFMREAMREYDNIQMYLHDQNQVKKQVVKLRRRILRFWVSERKRVSISREEILDILTRLYPRQIHFLWSVKKIILK